MPLTLDVCIRATRKDEMGDKKNLVGAQVEVGTAILRQVLPLKIILKVNRANRLH